MRRAWTRLLAGISAACFALGAAAVAQSVSAKSTARRANETTLAGLRPGRDRARRAVILYKKPGGPADKYNELTWTSTCFRQLLVVEKDVSEKIETIRATHASWMNGDCAPLGPSPWRTGRGLRLGDPAGKVVELYGEPDSRSPSSRDGQRLELLYYAFDWAGPDVPQVMQVLCTVEKDGTPGKVVEITLAASSL